MLSVLCWKWRPTTKYRSAFGPQTVNTLRRMVARHYPAPHRFLCITDDATGLEPGIEVVPLWKQFGAIPNPWGTRNPSCYRRLRVFAPGMDTVLGERFVSLLIMFYNYGEPSFVESDSDHPRAERHRFTAVNAYDDMSWRSTNFYPATAPGCLVKVLRFDERSQAFTFLYCMTPNFWQDNISYHDCAEESYHIWGTSWMMQFGEFPTGGYFWRPPYINHGAFACKLGTLALGRTDSQLYNHFHFNPWTTPEENLERAASRVGNRAGGSEQVGSDPTAEVERVQVGGHRRERPESRGVRERAAEQQHAVIQRVVGGRRQHAAAGRDAGGRE